MKKFIILSALLAVISTTTFSQSSSFKADDFREFVDHRITLTLKEYSPTVDFGVTFYLKEVKENYLICTLWKNNDNYIVYILIDQIAGFGIKKEKMDSEE